MNRIKKALEKCRTYVAVQKFGCGHTGIGHGVEDNLLQLLNEAFEELARLEKREPTLMSDCISAGLPLDVALKYDVQLFRLTNYVRDKALEELKKGPVGELVLVHRKVLNKLGIYDEVINTVAHTPAQQEPVATEHPLVAYAESYEQIARSGSSGKVSALAVATDIRQNMIPLTAANVDLSNAATLSASKQEPVAKVTDVFPTRVEWLREVAVNSLLYAAPVERHWYRLQGEE